MRLKIAISLFLFALVSITVLAEVATHKVKKGETVYGIAHAHGLKPDELIALNPSAADGIRPGDILVLNKPDTHTTPAVDETKEANVPQIPSDEITPAKLPVFEPAPRPNTNIKPQKEIWIEPEPEPSIQSAPEPSISIEPVDATNLDLKERIRLNNDVDEDEILDNNEVENDAEQPLTISILLPFMLNEANPGRATQLYTEFYRGMLLGAKEKLAAHKQKINLKFFDTAASNDTVNALVQRGELAESDIIISPENSAQIQTILDGINNQTLLLNIFSVKDTLYQTNPNLIQTNIPHNDMYRLAADAFVERFGDALPVFISRKGGAADKDGFITMLKERLTANDIQYQEIVFSPVLTDEDLENINTTEQKVVFVPNSGSKSEFAKYIAALTSLRNEALSPSNITIFGYPEWVTFRDSSFDEICNLEATIYSRYMVNAADPAARAVRNSYRTEFNLDMHDAVPTQGILGYDFATYVIDAIRHLASTGNLPAEFDGIQTHLMLERASDDVNAGLVNKALFLLKYNNDGSVEEVVL